MNWIPAITTTLTANALIALLFWLLRSLIITRLSNAVQYEFDVKIEGIKSEMRNTEEAFKAELRGRDTAIAAVRSAALDSLSTNRAVLSKRRLEAVDQLLRAMKVLSVGRWAVSLITILKLDDISERIERDPKLPRLFEALDFGGEKFLKDLNASEAALARPYVSEVTWAHYVAYEAVVAACASQIRMLRLGFSPKKFLDLAKLAPIIKGALPEYADFIDKSGSAGYDFLVRELERRLIDGLRSDAEGHASSEASIKEAAALTRAASEVMSQVAVASTRAEMGNSQAIFAGPTTTPEE